MRKAKIHTPRKEALSLVFPAIISLLMIIAYHDLTIDDSYILYRYGKNLVEFGIWNYNPVPFHLEEAYTSLTAALIGIIPALFNMPPSVFFLVFNLLMFALLIKVSLSEVRQNQKNLVWLIATNALFFVHFFSGMETFFFMGLILIIGMIGIKEKYHNWLPIISILIFLTRPDGIVFSLYGLYLFGKGDRKRMLLSGFSVFTLGIYWIIRANYFDSWLPNPVLLKSFNAFNPTIFFYNLYDAKWYLALLALIYWIKPNRTARELSLIAMLSILVFYGPSRLMMNYGDRFFFQVSFPVFILAALYLKHHTRWAMGIILLFNLYSLTPFRWNPLISYGGRLDRSYVDLGKRLEPFAGSRSMITGEGGALPYYSGWRNYDPIGLGTKRSEPLELVDLISDSNPDLIFFYENARGEEELVPGQPVNSEVINTMASLGFEKIAYCWFSPNYRIISYLNMNKENSLEIKEALLQNEQYSRSSITEFDEWVYSVLGYS